MKYFIATILLITISTKRCKSQLSLKEILASSQAEFNWKGYSDTNSIFYQSGKAWGIVSKILFDSVDFFKNDYSFNIVGQVVIDHENSVRFGFCCFNIFLAEVSGDSLVNILKVGETNSDDVNSNMQDGYFQVKIQPKKGQRLFFASSTGEGLREYSLDKLTEKLKKD